MQYEGRRLSTSLYPDVVRITILSTESSFCNMGSRGFKDIWMILQDLSKIFSNANV